MDGKNGKEYNKNKNTVFYMIRCIIFDAYGTLISTGTGSLDAVKAILNGKDIAVTADEFYKRWKMYHKSNMKNAYGFICEREIFELDLKMLYEFYSINSDYKRDIRPMLDSLYNRKMFDETAKVLGTLLSEYEIAIASNTDTEPLMQNLEYNQLKINNVFTSEVMKAYKPDKYFYEKILKELCCASDEVLFVGDSPQEDIIAPSGLGIKTVFIDRKKCGTDYGQTYTIDDLYGLLKIV